MKIYIASLGEHVGNIKEDKYIRDAYILKGLPADIINLWSLPKLVSSGDIILLKSIWGYHLNIDLFLSTLSTLENKGVRVINRYDFIRWNVHKFEYLKDISHQVPVIPTFVLDVKNEDIIIHLEDEIKNISISCNSNKLVIKPTISASGFLTYVYQIGMDNKDVISSIIQNNERTFIVQPYRDSVVKGEISIVLLKGEILYGIIRRPGVFFEKKSPELVSLENIPPQIFDTLKNLTHFFAEKFGLAPDICRVDFLENKEVYEILEVELIDPDLYIKYLSSDLRQEVLSIFYDML